LRWIGGGALAVLWLVLAIGLARTRVPWSNEAWSAIPAINLIEHGNMGTTILESKGTWLRGLDRHTYWIMPLHTLAQALWYKLVGFSLLRQRLLSILFAVILLGSWFVIVKRTAGDGAAAFFAVAIIGFERNFLDGAANGRMDMMCAALGAAGLAAWVALHERARAPALLISNALAALAMLTHPCGAIFAAVLIAFILMSGGARKMDWLLVIGPYVICGGLWGLYILQAPADFHAQFFGNASGFAGEYLQRARFNGLKAPWRAVWDEVRLRYLAPFGFTGTRSATAALHMLWLLFCVAAIAVVAAIRELRRRGRDLLIALLICLSMMTFLEGMKFQHYLVYSVAFIGGAAAVACGWLWNKGGAARAGVAGLTALLLGCQAGLALHAIRENALKSQFLPVAEEIGEQLRPGESVIAGAEFGYALGFNDRLHDDVRLGLNTGLRPALIVTEGWYRDWVQAAAKRDPAAHDYIEQLLSRDYRRIDARGDYVVYRRTAQ